jgi:tetratricopeptide (TPR) repeat protein
MLLATVYRRTSDPKSERAILGELAARDGSASEAFLRLMELGEAARDWPAVLRDARRQLAVNPLSPVPHRYLARAAEALGERELAIDAYRAVALLDETDVAEVHYRLAILLRQSGKPADARREALKALEDAPRFLEAHRLLLELVDAQQPPKPEGRKR